MKNAVSRGFHFEDLLYLTGLFVMLISQYLGILAFFKYPGSIICFVYLFRYFNKQIDKIYVRWIIILVSFYLLSVVWSINYKVSIYLFVVHLIPYFLLTFATMNYFDSYIKLKRILITVFICGLLLLVYLSANIDDFIIGSRLGSSLNEDNPEDHVWNANVIGMSLCFSIYAGFLLYNSINKGFFKKTFLIISIFVMMIASLLTGSRKVLLMLAIPIFYFLYKNMRKYFLLGLVVSVVVLLSAYYLILNVEYLYSTIGSRTEDMIAIVTGNTTGHEDNSRSYLAQYGFQWWQDNPILGIGINCYRELSNVTSMFRGKNFYAHNNYIELLVDVGVIGVVLYYRGYFYLLKESLKNKSIAMSCVFILTIVIFALDIGNVSYYDMRVQLLLVILFCVLKIEKEITRNY